MEYKFSEHNKLVHEFLTQQAYHVMLNALESDLAYSYTNWKLWMDISFTLMSETN